MASSALRVAAAGAGPAAIKEVQGKLMTFPAGTVGPGWWWLWCCQWILAGDVGRFTRRRQQAEAAAMFLDHVGDVRHDAAAHIVRAGQEVRALGVVHLFQFVERPQEVKRLAEVAGEPARAG